MKHQKQKNVNDHQQRTPFQFLVERIHIKVKFCCRLYLQYFSDGENKKSKQMKIDQKNTMYKIDEEINWQNINPISNFNKAESAISIHVKLLSNKGLAFTAGLINISYAEFTSYSQTFTLKLNKAQDFDAYLDCRRIKVQSCVNIKRASSSQAIESIKNVNNLLENNGISQNSKIFCQQPLIKSQENLSVKSLSNSNTQSKSTFRKVKEHDHRTQYKNQQKQLNQRIQYLESQLHKNHVLFEKQKQIISLLQSKQKESNQQNKQLKKQIKINQLDTEDKRQKIRELEGQKVKLLMNSLQSQKQILSLKQKIGALIQKIYENIRNIFQDKNNRIVSQFHVKQNDKNKELAKNSFSKIVKKRAKYSEIKEGQQNSKVAFSAVRGLMNKQVGQGWLQDQSFGYRENNSSSVLSNTLYDMSISNINGKSKEQSPLKNNDKPIQLQPTFRSITTVNKQFIQEVSNNINKLQSMVSKNIQQIIECFAQIIQKNKYGGKDNSSGQQSLLNYLEQLQNGFQKQLGVLGQRQRIILYYEQTIQELNQTLSEKQNLIVQLQEQLFNLQEQKDQIKSQLHENNYAHAIKQQQYLKKIHILEYGTNMPDYSSSASPTKTIGKRKQHKTIHNPYEQQLIQYKEHLRMMEIDLLHERDEKSKIIHLLHQKQILIQQMMAQQRKIQFSLKFKQRMASLNQSIQVSIQNQESIVPQTNQKLTLQSIGFYDKEIDQ